MDRDPPVPPAAYRLVHLPEVGNLRDHAMEAASGGAAVPDGPPAGHAPDIPAGVAALSPARGTPRAVRPQLATVHLP